ncbi:hypothetical protein FAIPA1_370031 [Frankia sp. AiPs1]
MADLVLRGWPGLSGPAGLSAGARACNTTQFVGAQLFGGVVAGYAKGLRHDTSARSSTSRESHP